MELTKRTGIRMAALAVVVLLLPLLVFPRQFGTELARGSLVNAIYELVFYGVVLFLANRRVTLIQLLEASGVCLIFRLLMGTLFGLLIALLYSMNLSISLQLGLSSYLPAILFHILVMPFLAWPILSPLLKYRPKRRAVRPEAAENRSLETSGTSIAISKERGVVSEAETPQSSLAAERAKPSEPAPATDTGSGVPSSGANGFDRAIYYIGEHSSVHMAAVVDNEGLLISQFVRGDVDPEAWAPLAELLMASNEQVLHRVTTGLPEKIDLLVGGYRVVASRRGWYNLIVVAERQTDDFLNIRINQGLEVIRRYVEERYNKAEPTRSEKTYV